MNTCCSYFPSAADTVVLWKDYPIFKRHEEATECTYTKTFGRITEITQSTEPVTPAQIFSLRMVLEQLRQKKVTLEEIDGRIANAIEDVATLEEEICEVEEYRTVLTEKIAFLQNFISLPVTSLPVPPTVHPASTSDIESPPEPVVSTNPSGSVTSPLSAEHATDDETHQVPLPSHVSDSTHSTAGSYSPSKYKQITQVINLPYFLGDPLAWQTFWDSFEAATHSNLNLTGVQKFNYLRAQLQSDTARVVAGFPLTNSNYEHSVLLLRQRFGQSYK